MIKPARSVRHPETGQTQQVAGTAPTMASQQQRQSYRTSASSGEPLMGQRWSTSEPQQPTVYTQGLATSDRQRGQFAARDSYGEQYARDQYAPEQTQPQTWQYPSQPSYRTPLERENAENLRIYQELVGIISPPDLSDPQIRASSRSYLCFKRPSKNVGFYQGVMNEEIKATVWYHTSTWGANILLALQVAIAATLTALGVTKSHQTGIAITILGAINTAVATGLAYLKAKGLPMRALVYLNDLKRLREHIEYTERQFKLGVAPRNLDPAQAAQNIKESFDQVQKVQEKQEADAEMGVLSSHPAGKLSSPVDVKQSSGAKDPSSATMPTAPPGNVASARGSGKSTRPA